MFTTISWTDYIVIVTILLAIYYLVIGLRFYFHELKNVFLKGSIRLNAVSHEAPGKRRSYSESGPGVSEPYNHSSAEDADETYQEVEDLIIRLKITIEEGVRNQLPKQEFSQNLKSILKEYSSLRNSTFRAAIIELIISECEKNGSTILNEDELTVLWDSD
jgi:hypothetical protein